MPTEKILNEKNFKNHNKKMDNWLCQSIYRYLAGQKILMMTISKSCSKQYCVAEDGYGGKYPRVFSVDCFNEIFKTPSYCLQIHSSAHASLYSFSHSTDSFGLACGPDTID